MQKYADAIALDFPPDHTVTFDELTAYTESKLRYDRPFILISESISGPIAMRIATKYPEVVEGVALIGTYVSNPVRKPLAMLKPFIRPFLFKRKPPVFLLRLVITGFYRELLHLMPKFQEVALSVNPEVLAARVRTALTMDATKELKAYHKPVLNVVAKWDRVLWRTTAFRMWQLRPDIERIYTDTGHCMIECWPEKMAEVIKPWILKTHAKS